MTSTRLRLAAVLASVTLAAGACGGGGGGPGGSGDAAKGAEGGGVGSTDTGDAGDAGGGGDSGPLRQDRFDASLGVVVLSEFAGALHDRFALEEDEITVFDPAAGDELEYDSPASQERYELAQEHGFLGLFSGVFDTADGGELWELTSEVFREQRGAALVFERHGTQGGGVVANSELLESERHSLGEGRTGMLVVERYVHRVAAEGEVHETGEFFELRGTLLDDNVLHHVLAVVDVDAPESADPVAAVRRALLAVEGVYRRAWESRRQ